jgi:tetratricopeptide (TPR) repeat protein
MFALAWTLNSFSGFYGRPREDCEFAETVYRLDPQDPDHRVAALWCAAKEGDWARLDSLLGKNHRLTRRLRAFSSGDEAAQEQVISEARRAADASPIGASRSLQMYLEDAPAAAQLARLAVLDALPPDSQAAKRLWVAQLEVALGRWRAAEVELARVSTLKPRWSSLYRALWASSAHSTVSHDALRSLFDSLATRDAEAPGPSVTHRVARAHDLLASQLRLYVLGRLGVRLGDAESALRYAAELEEMGNPPSALSYAFDRAQSLRAHVLFARGQLEEALEALEAQPRRLRIQWLFNVPFYASPEDRFLRGEILVQLNRFNDALRWYETINDVYRHDVHYLAVAHLRQAEVYEQLGEPDNAALHYRKFLYTWQHSDLELQPLVEQARYALERLTGERLMP